WATTTRRSAPTARPSTATTRPSRPPRPIRSAAPSPTRSRRNGRKAGIPMSIVKSTTIVGAGIAGLTAALALARKGIAVHVLEQAPALEEVGAGLQLSPNASRILADLGLLDALSARWTEP